MNMHNWLKQTKKELIYLLILIILLVIFAKALHKADSNEQKETTNSNEIVVSNKLIQKEYVYSSLDKHTVKIASLDETVETEPADGIEFEYYYDSIPLDKEVQQYIYELSEENDLSYTLILAIAKVESNFDADIISHTNDAGLMQLNRSTTMTWLSDQIELDEEFNWKNPKHNVTAAVWYLTYLRNEFRGMGFSEEDVFNLTIISYNRGKAGGLQYVRNYGWNNGYLDKVYNAKTELEMEGGEF
jgi:membrane-bound lytic murein transglycosylase MltF